MRFISKFLKILTINLIAIFGYSVAMAGGSFDELPPQWAGGYAGIHLGYVGETNIDGIFDGGEPVATESIFLDELNPDGVKIGVHIGHLWQSGNFVYGLEGDFSKASAKDRIEDIENDSPGLGNGQDSAKTDIEYLASLRARAGIASDSLFVYATAGISYANTEFTVTNATGLGQDNEGDTALGSTSTDLDSFGYVVGAGIETNFKGARIRLEGLYYGFDEKENTSTLNPDSDPGDFVEVEDLWSVRVGLSVPFNGSE